MSPGETLLYEVLAQVPGSRGSSGLIVQALFKFQAQEALALLQRHRMDLDAWCDQFIDESEVEATAAPSTDRAMAIPDVPPLPANAGGDVEPPLPPLEMSAEPASMVEKVEATSSATVDIPEVEFSKPDIVDTWFPHISEPLAGVRDFRGRENQQCNGASMCTGMAPESKANERHKIDTKWHFMTDNKEAAFNFVMENCPTPERFLVEAAELFTDEDNETESEEGAKCTARDAMNAFTWAMFFLPKLLLDIFVGGVTCRPFSAARTGRHAGTTDHPEAHLIWDFLRVLKWIQPRFACLEEVWGFAMPESVHDPISPLKRMLDYVVEQAHTYPYFVRVYVVCTSTMLRWKRRRLYITFFHHEAGGEESSILQETMIKAGLNMDWE